MRTGWSTENGLQSVARASKRVSLRHNIVRFLQWPLSRWYAGLGFTQRERESHQWRPGRTIHRAPQSKNLAAQDNHRSTGPIRSAQPEHLGSCEPRAAGARTKDSWPEPSTNRCSRQGNAPLEVRRIGVGLGVGFRPFQRSHEVPFIRQRPLLRSREFVISVGRDGHR